MPVKDKYRHYITLQHRREKPGFHWALVLVPKVESLDSSIKDSHIFHVTNSLQPGVTVGIHDQINWRYEEKPVNSQRSGTLVGRILVAKLSTSLSLETRAAHINVIVQGVTIVQNDTA